MKRNKKNNLTPKKAVAVVEDAIRQYTGTDNIPVVNKNLKDEEQLLVMNEVINRMGLASQLSIQTFGGDRDIYKALGYPTSLSFTDYFARYDRQDIAKAIIDRPVKKTWQGDITLVEPDSTDVTPLEKQWKQMVKKYRLKRMFTRVDKLTGLGKYCILLFGTSDVKKAEDWGSAYTGNSKLIYLKPFSEDSVSIRLYETDPNNNRYGYPKIYDITVTQSTEGSSKTIGVHYSRVLHIVDDVLESDIEGTPRLKAIFNRLIDLEKIVGGSGEMFWRGARPGYTGKLDKDFQLTPTTEQGFKDQIKEYENNLRRFLINEGIEIKSLETQVADPSNHVNTQIEMISAQTGIPKRILMGSERGELSSIQDTTEWKAWIQERREEYAEEAIVRPFVDKCIEMKLLPLPLEEDTYEIQWSDLFAMSDKDKADIAKLRAETLKEYLTAPGAEAIIPSQAFLQYFSGLKEEDIELIMQMAKEALAQEPVVTEEEEEIIEKENHKPEEE